MIEAEAREIDRVGLTASDVASMGDAMFLRYIRNTCRDGFAHDTEEINPVAQAKWFTSMQGRLRAWLYWTTEGLCVGYGLLRQTEDGRWWSSVAVLPEYAGRGYGGAITADIIRRVDHVVWAQARKDNPAAIRLHREADWEVIGEDDRLVHFRTRPVAYAQPGDYPPDVIAAMTEGDWTWPREATEQWAEHGWART